MDSKFLLFCMLIIVDGGVFGIGHENTIDGTIERVIRHLVRSKKQYMYMYQFDGPNEKRERDEALSTMLEKGSSLVELDILVPNSEKEGRERLCKILLRPETSAPFRQLIGRLQKERFLAREKRKVTVRASRLWSDINVFTSTNNNTEVIIPVDFSNMALDSRERREFETAFDHISSTTCVRFTGVPASQRRDPFFSFLDLKGGTNVGCASRIGRLGGRQSMYLGARCVKPQVLIHEFLHTVGLIHEHSRPDRSQNIQIVFENVVPGMEFNFVQTNTEKANTLGIPYDFTSIMHYSPYAFSKNGQPTMRPVKASSFAADTVGTAKQMSQYDSEAVNKLYNCAKPIRGIHTLNMTQDGLQLFSRASEIKLASIAF